MLIKMIFKSLSVWTAMISMAFAVADPFAAFGVPAAAAPTSAPQFSAPQDFSGASGFSAPAATPVKKSTPKKATKTAAAVDAFGGASNAFGGDGNANAFGGGSADFGAPAASGGFGAASPAPANDAFGGGAGGGFGAPAAAPAAPADTGGGLLSGLKDVLGAVKDGIKTAKDLKESTSGLGGGSSGSTSSFGTGF